MAPVRPARATGGLHGPMLRKKRRPGPVQKVAAEAGRER